MQKPPNITIVSENCNLFISKKQIFKWFSDNELMINKLPLSFSFRFDVWPWIKKSGWVYMIVFGSAGIPYFYTSIILKFQKRIKFLESDSLDKQDQISKLKSENKEYKDKIQYLEKLNLKNKNHMVSINQKNQTRFRILETKNIAYENRIEELENMKVANNKK